MEPETGLLYQTTKFCSTDNKVFLGKLRAKLELNLSTVLLLPYHAASFSATLLDKNRFTENRTIVN